MTDIEQQRAINARLTAETNRLIDACEQDRKYAKVRPVVWAVAFVVAVYTVSRYLL